MIKLLVGIPSVGVLILLISNFIFAALLGLTYNNLSKETPIARIQFDSVNNAKEHIAHIFDKDGSKLGDFTVYGDQWRMDAEFIKLKYLANVVGMESKYTLNRFEGRYKNIEDENANKHRAYQLEDHALVDTFSFFVDSAYGSSVYKEIKLNTLYTIYKSTTGLFVREKTFLPIKEKGWSDKIKSFFI